MFGMRFFRRVTSFLADTIQTFVVTAAIFVIVYLFLFQPHQVVGDSMVPNFHNSEYIITDKISYRVRSVQRGEVIIFKAPKNIEKDFIKRIIALPGERIKIEDGRVFINGHLLDESEYIPTDIKTFAGSIIREGIEYEVPQDSYFALGDNRLNSADSREWGFIKKNEIIGRSLLVYWPPNSFRLVKLDKSF